MHKTLVEEGYPDNYRELDMGFLVCKCCGAVIHDIFKDVHEEFHLNITRTEKAVQKNV